MKGNQDLNIEIMEKTRDWWQKKRYNGMRIWAQVQQNSTLETEMIESQYVTIAISHPGKKIDSEK